MAEPVGGCPVHRTGLLFWLPFAATAVLLAFAAALTAWTTCYRAATVLLLLALVSLPIAVFHPACRAANRWFGYGHDHKETP